MALAREARGVGDIEDRPIRVPKKIARPLDPSFHHVTVGRLSGRNSECLAEVMRAQLDDRGQLDEPELIGQMRLDVFENAPNLPRRKPPLCGIGERRDNLELRSRRTASAEASPSR